jgi:uncharacterized protein
MFEAKGLHLCAAYTPCTGSFVLQPLLGLLHNCCVAICTTLLNLIKIYKPYSDFQTLACFMYEEEFKEIKLVVLHRLANLQPTLTYHSPAHTLDVLQQCERIAAAEGLTGQRELFLLRVAALYHDTGFLTRYADHEEESCRIFLADAVHHSFSEEDKNDVLHMIMATRLPQQPETLSERIICDADLDYLGRADFPTIGDRLRREFISHGIVANNDGWQDLQLRFLHAHQYHTASSRALREPVKQLHLQECIRERELTRREKELKVKD